MFQILTEALEANSLEHKLEMQIKASLKESVMNEKLELADKLPLPKKLNINVFTGEPADYEMEKVNDFLKKCFGITYKDFNKLNYAVVTNAFFNRNFKDGFGGLGNIEWCSWSVNKRVYVDGYEDLTSSKDKQNFCVCHIFGTKKTIIFSNLKELDLTKFHPRKAKTWD